MAGKPSQVAMPTVTIEVMEGRSIEVFASRQEEVRSALPTGITLVRSLAEAVVKVQGIKDGLNAWFEEIVPIAGYESAEQANGFLRSLRVALVGEEDASKLAKVLADRRDYLNRRLNKQGEVEPKPAPGEGNDKKPNVRKQVENVHDKAGTKVLQQSVIDACKADDADPKVVAQVEAQMVAFLQEQGYTVTAPRKLRAVS